SQRSRRHNRAVVPRTVLVLDGRIVQTRHLFANHANARLRFDRLRDTPRKLYAIDSQRVTSRYCASVRNAQKRRLPAPHLLFQQPRRGPFRFALERIRANQLTEIRGLVSRCQARFSIHHRAHLIEIHLAAQPRRRQRRLRPGQPAANHANPHGVAPDAVPAGFPSAACCPILSPASWRKGGRVTLPRAPSISALFAEMGGSPFSPGNSASRRIASPPNRTLRHSSRNSAPMAA